MSTERRSAAGEPHVPETAPEIQEILAYHEATKHSPESIRRTRWAMDWSNKPHPFKRYAGLPRIGGAVRHRLALRSLLLSRLKEEG